MWASASQTPVVFASNPTSTEYGPTTGVFWRGVWRSVVLDLQPELAGAFGARSDAQPIWPGQNARLYVATVANNSLAQMAMNVYALDYGHPTDPSRAALLNQRQNISEDWYAHYAHAKHGVTDAILTGMLVFAPPCGAVRYWSVVLVFDVVVNVATPPVIVVDGAAY